MKSYIVKLASLTVLMLLVVVLYQRFMPSHLVSNGLLYLPFVFFVITLLSKFILFKGDQSKQENIIKNFMLSVGIKFFIYLTIMIAYAFIFPNDSVKFILSFFVFYLIYTTFDSINNLRILKEKD